MAICEIHAIPGDNGRAAGQAIPWCATHDMQVVSRLEPLCPLGRIEQATALAIERISEEAEHVVRRMLVVQTVLARQLAELKEASRAKQD
jgi:hypothetical protein